MTSLFLTRPTNLCLALWALCALSWKVSTNAQIVSSEIIHRDYDSAVQRNIHEELGDDGSLVLRTNQFTILENNMHYLEGGEWKTSEDVLEIFPGGVIARRGPNRAIFSPTLNSPAVFDILTRNGGRVRGGVRSILATDFSTGESVVLATVRNGARAELLDTDKVLYDDAFEGGLKASVIYIWRHNLFCQELVLLEKPILPGDFNPATVRLEIITEFLEVNPTKIVEREAPFGPDIALRDHATISFGDLAIVTGSAFPFDAAQLGKIDPAESSTRVTKEWQETSNNNAVLIESVSWMEILPHLDELPENRAAVKRRTKRETILASTALSRPAGSDREKHPVQLAQAPYRPDGYVIDFTVFPDSPLEYTLRSTNTYYIKTSYYTGSAVTFEPGTVIKYKTNANMLLYGSVSFPSTFQTPVFTSREDDGFGQKIENVSGETGEDAVRDPATHKAAQAIWIYFVNSSTTIQNARVRWAKRGIQYDANSGVTANHYLNDSMFENCDIGVYANVPSAFVYLSNCTKQNVTTPTSGQFFSGSLGTAKFYSDVASPGMTSLETGIAVADTMGAVGTNYIVQMLNGRIAVFDRNTTTNSNPYPWRVREADLHQFFAITNGAEVYPKGFRVADPRLIYDHLSGRWIACAMDMVNGLTNNNILLAVSKGPDPITLNSTPSATDTNWIADKWNKYVVALNLTNLFTDYPALGVDKNGIYIAAHYITNGVNDVITQRIVALPKTPFVSGTAPTLQPASPTNIFGVNLGPGVKAIQPAHNFEASPTGDIAWFLSRGAPYTNASGYRPGKILYGQLKWTGSGFVKQTNWFNSSNGLEAPTALSYWDIPDDQGGGFDAPQKPKGTNNTSVPLRRGFGTHVMSAVLQNGELWMCQHVGFNSSGGYATNSAATRSGIVWYKFQVNAGSPPTLSHTASPSYGKIYDGSGAPYWYYFPSLMANGQGDIVVGFSGSKSTEHIGAFHWGRRADGTSVSRPILVQAGREYVHFLDGVRWGDYSATALDPIDRLTFCTFQQYAEISDPDVLTSTWGTWISTINVSP